MNWNKITLYTLVGIISLPTIALGGSLTTSLVQGKTPEEAVRILATQIDTLFNKVEVLESDMSDLETANQEIVNETNYQAEQLERLEAENQALRESFDERDLDIREQIASQSEEQERLRSLDKYCEELSQSGSKYFPTKQHIIPLYESLLRQANETFEVTYAEDLEDLQNKKPKTREEYRVQWEENIEMGYYATRKEPLESYFEDDYQEYLVFFNQSNRISDNAEEKLRENWTIDQAKRRENLAKITPYYEEYLRKCQ